MQVALAKADFENAQYETYLAQRGSFVLTENRFGA